MEKTLRLILGDQLSQSISSLEDCDKANDIILMCEVLEEATYVKHHKKRSFFYFLQCGILRNSLPNKALMLNMSSWMMLKILNHFGYTSEDKKLAISQDSQNFLKIFC